MHQQPGDQQPAFHHRLDAPVIPRLQIPRAGLPPKERGLRPEDCNRFAPGRPSLDRARRRSTPQRSVFGTTGARMIQTLNRSSDRARRLRRLARGLCFSPRSRVAPRTPVPLEPERAVAEGQAREVQWGRVVRAAAAARAPPEQAGARPAEAVAPLRAAVRVRLEARVRAAAREAAPGEPAAAAAARDPGPAARGPAATEPEALREAAVDRPAPVAREGTAQSSARTITPVR